MCDVPYLEPPVFQSARHISYLIDMVSRIVGSIGLYRKFVNILFVFYGVHGVGLRWNEYDFFSNFLLRFGFSPITNTKKAVQNARLLFNMPVAQIRNFVV
jgi:hypothetical protein